MTSATSTAQSTGGATGPSKTRRVRHQGTVLMLSGGVLAFIGSLLPWLTTPVGSLSGMAGPGLWTLSAGMLGLAGALLPFRRVALAHAAIPGLAIAVIVVWQLARIGYVSATTGSWGQLLPGMGLVMVGGAAALLLRAALRIRNAS